MSKQALPQEFELQNILYKLAYFPNLQDFNSIPPDFSQMRIQNNGSKEININGNKKVFIWKGAIIPASSISPEKHFLMFALTDNYINPELIAPNQMICYAMQPKQQQAVDLEQAFINCIFGVPQQQTKQENVNNSWANDMFEVKKEEEQAQEPSEVEGVAEDDA